MNIAVEWNKEDQTYKLKWDTLLYIMGWSLAILTLVSLVVFAAAVFEFVQSNKEGKEGSKNRERLSKLVAWALAIGLGLCLIFGIIAAVTSGAANINALATLDVPPPSPPYPPAAPCPASGSVDCDEIPYIPYWNETAHKLATDKKSTDAGERILTLIKTYLGYTGPVGGPLTGVFLTISILAIMTTVLEKITWLLGFPKFAAIVGPGYTPTKSVLDACLGCLGAGGDSLKTAVEVTKQGMQAAALVEDDSAKPKIVPGSSHEKERV